MRYACVGRVLLRARRERKRMEESFSVRVVFASPARRHTAPTQYLITINTSSDYTFNTSSCYTINQYLILLHNQYHILLHNQSIPRPATQSFNTSSCYTINQYLILLHNQYLFLRTVTHLLIATQSRESSSTIWRSRWPTLPPSTTRLFIRSSSSSHQNRYIIDQQKLVVSWLVFRTSQRQVHKPLHPHRRLHHDTDAYNHWQCSYEYQWWQSCTAVHGLAGDYVQHGTRTIRALGS